MNISNDEIKLLFSSLSNIQTCTISNSAKAGETIWFKLPQGRVQGVCIRDTPSGSCAAFLADNGQWYLMGAEVTIGEINNRREISYRRTGRKEDVVYPIISLQQHELFEFNPDFSTTDFITTYWLTGGGRYRLKELITEPPLGFRLDNAFNQFDGGDAFVMNLGRGKQLTSTNRFVIPSININSNTYFRQEFLTTRSKREIVVTTSEMLKTEGSPFGYLGNGIYQSQIENGMGQCFDIIEPGMTVVSGNQTYIENRGTPNEFTYGFGKNFFIVTGASERRNANILPINKNVVINGDEIIELPGSLSIDITGIYDFDLATNREGESFFPIENNDYARLLVSSYNKGTFPGNAQSGSKFTVRYRDRPLFGWRNRSISHTTWLPNGNKTFIFNSSASKSGTVYNYTETMSGELMVVSWDKKYIVHKFNNLIKVSTLNVDPDNSSFSENFTNTGNQTLTFKTYGDIDDEQDLILDSNSKFLCINKSFINLNDDTRLKINLNTSSFRVRIGETFNQHKVFSPNLNLSSYLNEAIITSVTINNDNYLIRGNISNITHLDGEFIYFTINISEFKKIPSVKSVGNNFVDINGDKFKLTLGQPFPNSIILDNGCFWNYYLNNRHSNVLVENRLGYRRFTRTGNGLNTILPITNSNAFDYVYCDQTVPFIHTNPITVPFCNLYTTSHYKPPSNILKSDNLVDKYIYSVDEYNELELYIDSFLKSDFNTTKIPVTEWKITEEGKIKYNKTFLVDYRRERPFIDSGQVDGNLISIGNSYYPQ